MSTGNFIELATLTPLPNQSIHSPTFIIALQKLLNMLASTPGALTFQIRKFSSPSASTPQLLLLASWSTKAAHDYCDIHGLTTKLLKVMFERVVPVDVYYLSMDCSLVDFEAGEIGMEVFHVKEGEREEFEKVVKENGRVGAWYVYKGIPPLPEVLPSDETELRILEKGMEVVEKKEREKVPDIWISLSLDEGSGRVFGEKVEGLVERVEVGRWEKYLEGRRDASLGGIDLD